MTSAVPFRDATASEVEAAPGTREQKAARYVAARKFGGIPTKAFLMGGNDHSPMMKGVLDLTTVCFALLDRLEEDELTAAIRNAPNGGHLLAHAEELREMLTDHGCPADLTPDVQRDGD